MIEGDFVSNKFLAIYINISILILIRGSSWKFEIYLDIPVSSWTAGSSLRPLPVNASLGHFAFLKLNKSCIINRSWWCNKFNKRYCSNREVKVKT